MGFGPWGTSAVGSRRTTSPLLPALEAPSIKIENARGQPQECHTDPLPLQLLKPRINASSQIVIPKRGCIARESFMVLPEADSSLTKSARNDKQLRTRSQATTLPTSPTSLYSSRAPFASFYRARTRYSRTAPQAAAPPDFAAHRDSHFKCGWSAECGRAGLSSRLQYLSDVFFQSTPVGPLRTGSPAMRRNETAAGEV